ncbi:hypothetical protein CAPTEDRAFT_195705 [Capitella teleta]|uniref:Citrate transporter-like domain-containing protein n=1 Tax=Capitella teleta TaxID=283909 RepID=X1ZVE6_CAPTE|nr:hypothetical protein CAPTEDRAFT_195705 [Capitella teleta]|eukprot:ELT88417.1 hypothetical protein CAPTEDRAFT_195705 [Capitella teleta]
MAGYCLLLMATYWCTEAVPMPVTALIPLFLFPMLGVLKIDEVVVNYSKEITMMFMGGLVVAIAIEKCELHTRIALLVLKGVGTETKWLLLGFMLPTWFLSMWISNTATAGMMLPLVEAVLDQLDPEHRKKDEITEKGHTNEGLELNENKESENEIHFIVAEDPGTSELPVSHSQVTLPCCKEPETVSQEEKDEFQKIAKALTLLWEGKGLKSPIHFPSWLVYALPVSVMVFAIVWFWMQIMYIGCKKTFCCCRDRQRATRDDGVKRLIDNEYAKLGPMKFSEAAVAVLFVLLVLLWFFRAPDFLSGWSETLPAGFTKDSVPAWLVACLLFMIPSELPSADIWNKDGHPKVEPLMDWGTLQRRMPWGTLILLGGGFALADAVTKSGLSEWLGKQLGVFEALSDWSVVLILSFLVAMLTEVTSNTASCTLLMPIMAEMSLSMGKSPLYLMFPIAIATSFAFMLPVSTPPNAIAFSFGRVRVVDMAKTGFILNFASVFVLTLANETWASIFFNTDVIPWDVAVNSSATF